MIARLCSVAMVVLALVVAAAVAASAAVFDATNPEVLEEREWSERTFELQSGAFSTEEQQGWCKTLTRMDGDDRDTFGIDAPDVQETIHDIVVAHRGAEPRREEDLEAFEEMVTEETDVVMGCVSPDKVEEKFFCVMPNLDLPPLVRPAAPGSQDQFEAVPAFSACWDAASNPQREGISGAIADTNEQLGSMLDPVSTWTANLTADVRMFVAMLLYWWITIPHADITTSPAVHVLWPSMLGIGVFLATFLMIWQGVKIMFAQDARVLVSLLTGLMKFVLLSASGIALLAMAGHAAESATYGILSIAHTGVEEGCAGFQAQAALAQDQAGRPVFPSVDTSGMDTAEAEEAQANAALAESFGTCAAGKLAVTYTMGPIILLLFVIAFVVGLFQAFMLFLREAALPILAVLIPIVAAGQVGGRTTKQWLASWLSMSAALLLYKPLMAVIFAIGFTSSSLGSDYMDIVRGLVTLIAGVIAPMFLFKVFKTIMPTVVDEVSSAGGMVNNVFMASQMGGSVQQWAEKRAGASAARAAEDNAARAAAHQGGGVALGLTKQVGQQAVKNIGTGAAAGPVGVVAGALKTVADAGRKMLAGGKETEAVADAGAGAAGAAGHGPQGGPVPAPGTSGHAPEGAGSGAGGLSMREPGQPGAAPYPTVPDAPSQPGPEAAPPAHGGSFPAPAGSEHTGPPGAAERLPAPPPTTPPPSAEPFVPAGAGHPPLPDVVAPPALPDSTDKERP